MISEDQMGAEIINIFFIDIVSNLKIPTNHNPNYDFTVTNSQVENALNKFKNHSSTVMTKNKRKIDQYFSLGPVTNHGTFKKIDTAKASHKSDIPTKILKQNSDYFPEYFFRT